MGMGGTGGLESNWKKKTIEKGRLRYKCPWIQPFASLLKLGFYTLDAVCVKYQNLTRICRFLNE